MITFSRATTLSDGSREDWTRKSSGDTATARTTIASRPARIVLPTARYAAISTMNEMRKDKTKMPTERQLTKLTINICAESDADALVEKTWPCRDCGAADFDDAGNKCIDGHLCAADDQRQKERETVGKDGV
jgi:ribosomal protein L37AE/L43A